MQICPEADSEWWEGGKVGVDGGWEGGTRWHP